MDTEAESESIDELRRQCEELEAAHRILMNSFGKKLTKMDTNRLSVVSTGVFVDLPTLLRRFRSDNDRLEGSDSSNEVLARLTRPTYNDLICRGNTFDEICSLRHVHEWNTAAHWAGTVVVQESMNELRADLEQAERRKSRRIAAASESSCCGASSSSVEG